MKASKSYWKAAHEIGSAVYANRKRIDVDEQAGPAYFAGLRLSRWLFWKRLKLALQHVPTNTAGTCMDFGCGFGLALPLLREHFGNTTGVDLVPELAIEFMQRWDNQHPQNANAVTIVDSMERSGLKPASVDVILALDVLEHFESLDAILNQIHGILKPGGQLLVTGPTENWAYQIGRRMVGFTGEYHHQTIYDVLKEVAKQFDVQAVDQIPALVPLFLVAKATKR